MSEAGLFNKCGNCGETVSFAEHQTICPRCKTNIDYSPEHRELWVEYHKTKGVRKVD